MTDANVDTFGKELAVGQDVLYTTRDRYSGLNYGRIIDIYEGGGYHNGTKVKIQALTKDGQVQTVIEREAQTNASGEYIRDGEGRILWNEYDTGKPIRASILDYSPDKFYVL